MYKILSLLVSDGGLILFDERMIRKEHVERAINYLSGNFKHSPARSAFLMFNGQTACQILRLAFLEPPVKWCQTNPLQEEKPVSGF